MKPHLALCVSLLLAAQASHLTVAAEFHPDELIQKFGDKRCVLFGSADRKFHIRIRI
ncbi:MAG: hypothetical protein MUF86_08030 [Akkermansiaceae bacterium]|jgi:hypothetical protein|nr:hypothetical protein [Akkermansiaceae bacterium]